MSEWGVKRGGGTKVRSHNEPLGGHRERAWVSGEGGDNPQASSEREPVVALQGVLLLVLLLSPLGWICFKSYAPCLQGLDGCGEREQVSEDPSPC
ncbi:hypothetical protein ElyMa_005336500 [Elysia marginata]|uniref:KASH domain-containing protein n=1 Tax=Elysia marginata TaxID=1093978 RepID=A0AAV4E9J6_9GAST|nr:hypothetical protein ElyMa_005336500 [Elysia marginata]